MLARVEMMVTHVTWSGTEPIFSILFDHRFPEVRELALSWAVVYFAMAISQPVENYLYVSRRMKALVTVRWIAAAAATSAILLGSAVYGLKGAVLASAVGWLSVVVCVGLIAASLDNVGRGRPAGGRNDS